jgi:hypothetical protein
MQELAQPQRRAFMHYIAMAAAIGRKSIILVDLMLIELIANS